MYLVGKLFQVEGPANEKVRSWNLRAVCGTSVSAAGGTKALSSELQISTGGGLPGW